MENTTHPIHGHPVFRFREDRITSKNATCDSLIYQGEDARLLRWAADFPLPEIGDRLQPKLARIGTVEVTGYFRDGDQIGIIAITRKPHWWLTNENDRDRIASDSAIYRDGTMRSKLCLFGDEIEQPIEKIHGRKKSHSSQLRAERIAF